MRVIVRVRFAWWLLPYLKALRFFAIIMGATPDMAKLSAKVQRATRIEVLTVD